MTTMNKTSLADLPYNEAENDFGTERYVKGLIKFIENSSAPITIALQGEWGSGKTSLMTRLKRALCSTTASSYVGIEINTWEYSMMSSPEDTVFKIIERLVNELSNNDPKSKSSFHNFIKKAGNMLYRGGRESLKTIPGIGGLFAVGLEAANVPTNLPEATPEPEIVTLADLKATLEQAVWQTITEKNKQGIIVFVDDLDRLNPPVAVEILELLKNIFFINNCIFILAIDYEVVVKGLEPKFGKLTDKNEREFRSFFDKIIQVPFSLPVSSYRPMNFVLDSLMKIGYINGVEKDDPRFIEPFQDIVEKSVGKNPRSIKRLINTLSLLSCISEFGEEKEKDSDFIKSREGRIVNFAIVSIQVCYPKIFRMLGVMPDFTKWDNYIVKRFNIPITRTEDNNDSDWEAILEAACSTDKYLAQQFNDIRSLMLLIQSTLEEQVNEGCEMFENRIRSIIDKSSVTGISESTVTTEVDQRRLIAGLHYNVSKRMIEKRPDIEKIQTKRNTGNGGFYLFLPNGKYIDIIIRPHVYPGKIVCDLHLSTQIIRPESFIGKTWEEMIQDEIVNSTISTFDRCISPLLKNAYYFEGRIYPETPKDTYFKSFAEEQAYCSKQGFFDQLICANVVYKINLKNESLFEVKEIVNAIADVVLATYDLQVAAEKIYTKYESKDN